MEPRIWLIAGPTASGKSALALRLASAIGAEIVNADSMQLYSDLRLITARPSAEDEVQAPHHLFGTVDGADGWSVGHWLRATTQALDEIASRKRPAVIVGGTGLYFKALTQGLAEIPQVPLEVRARAQDDYDQMGEMDFRSRLDFIDPAAAARIAPGDRQRLVRAWAVFSATQTPLTVWQSNGKPAVEPGAWSAVALEPARAALYARCDTRLDLMVKAGALKEVAELAQRKLDPMLPIMKAVGVREFTSHLRGEMSLAAALASAQQETRRYAKRQTTWMRGQMAEWPRLTEIDPEGQWRQFLAVSPTLTA